MKWTHIDKAIMKLHADESGSDFSVSEILAVDCPSYDIFNIWSSAFAIVEPILETTIAETTIAVTNEVEEDDPYC